MSSTVGSSTSRENTTSSGPGAGSTSGANANVSSSSPSSTSANHNPKKVHLLGTSLNTSTAGTTSLSSSIPSGAYTGGAMDIMSLETPQLLSGVSPSISSGIQLLVNGVTSSSRVLNPKYPSKALFAETNCYIFLFNGNNL
ncbi:hypothetical protein DdX_14899 [Ditylenchus destructor]|uniref:Uncharacterized protein n=1 Tax=Ditylenchus destructor TaxID=166010 RepID=A0AAD4MT88_9BILA|nr:hypothetical protein DdX_14899 [Ditylenchus destructor]